MVAKNLAFTRALVATNFKATLALRGVVDIPAGRIRLDDQWWLAWRR